MLDLVIRGGTVVDGTGAIPRIADVAVEDGMITEVGVVPGPAARTLDAEGLVVTPGFVDVHTHFDGQVTWDPLLSPSCWHGVTTAILGNCGVGFAPVRPGERDFLVELMEGVEDIPGTALAEGIRWGWESFPEYLDALESMPRAMDIGAQVPHAAVRAYVMGRRAGEDATAEEIEAMRAIVVDSLRAGALGFSTGRTAGHRDVHGRPVPGTFAPREEVARLLDAVAEVGHGVVEIVPAGVGGVEAGDPEGAMDVEMEWMLRLASETKVPMTFLVLQNNLQPDAWRTWFEQARAVNAAGATLRPQVASRCFGMLMGHQSRMNPFRYSATYAGLGHLTHDARMERLHDPEVRSAILGDLADGLSRTESWSLDQLTTTTFEHLFPLGDPLEYEPTRDQSVAARAAREGRDPWEVAYDLLLGAGGREFLLLPLLNYGRGPYDGLFEMMSDPLTVQGLGDGGAHTSIICDASMTTYLLTHWVRDRTRGPRFPIEMAVRRLTSDPAALYGLDDRGTLAPGLRADINVIDFERLALHYPERVADLPAGATRLIQRSDGYVETIVSGETVMAEGESTGARPGRLIRGGSGSTTR